VRCAELAQQLPNAIELQVDQLRVQVK